jgi:predicted secreted protein
LRSPHDYCAILTTIEAKFAILRTNNSLKPLGFSAHNALWLFGKSITIDISGWTDVNRPFNSYMLL